MAPAATYKSLKPVQTPPTSACHLCGENKRIREEEREREREERDGEKGEKRESGVGGVCQQLAERRSKEFVRSKEV